MNMHVGKWGRSLAVRLPKRLVEKFGIRDGDTIDDAIMERVYEEMREERRQEALKKIAETKWKLPKDYKFDREEANAR